MSISKMTKMQFAASLSKCINSLDDVSQLAMTYLLEAEPLINYLTTEVVEPAKKRKKVDPDKKRKQLSTCDDLDLVKATSSIVQLIDLSTVWEWSSFFSQLHSGNKEVQWLSLDTIAVLTNMAPEALVELRAKLFTTKEQIQFMISAEDQRIQQLIKRSRTLGNKTEEQTAQTPLNKLLQTTPHWQRVVTVEGVALTRPVGTGHQCPSPSHLIVLVPTTRTNLQRLALAVGNGRPVLLEGPVGCGKTSLVEHLATSTGRAGYPHLMKIQLGDQTDSKMLLGTYQCTSVPGEFIWRPGTLTRALSEGHWILLEDLDFAPMDVISTLVPLLTSGTLTVQGHRVKAHPGFQIFATRRLLRASSGLFRNHSSGVEVVEKHFTKVTVLPLSRSELEQVISIKCPQLQSMAQKLVDIYLLLSSGQHG